MSGHPVRCWPPRLRERMGWASDMEAFFFVALVIVTVVLSLCWHFGRSNSLLHQWAAQNRYRIIRQEYRTLFKGPYF
jgi:hypothetical protein